MRLPLTPTQAAQIEPHLGPGFVLLGRVERETFNGTNAKTSGTLHLVFTEIPSERLDAVRRAIAGEAAPAPAKPKRRARA